MEHWFNEGVADGFNLMPPSLPHSLEDFVKYIIPELQRRSLFKNSYNQPTLRCSITCLTSFALFMMTSAS